MGSYTNLDSIHQLAMIHKDAATFACFFRSMFDVPMLNTSLYNWFRLPVVERQHPMNIILMPRTLNVWCN